MQKLLILICLVALALGIAGCDKIIKESDPVRDYNFNIQTLSYDDLYHQYSTLTNAYWATPADSNGVQMFLWENTLHYHPVQLAHRSLDLLSDYRLTNNLVYMQRAIISLETLRSRAIRLKKGIYFPYTFDYEILSKPELAVQAPWFSGMAQGMLLSCYSRLYSLTNNDLYKAVADSILYTMTDYASPYSPVMISEADGVGLDKDYYWVDEYPHPTRVYVLNGSIIGAMGLYDHWWVFGDRKSKTLLSRELTTLKDHVMLYRNEGDISCYDLRYRGKNRPYHQIHIDLLRLCHKISSDSYFQEVADLFASDYP